MGAGIYWQCSISQLRAHSITEFGIGSPREQSLVTPASVITGWIAPDHITTRICLCRGDEVLAESELHPLNNGMSAFRFPMTHVDTDLDIVAVGEPPVVLATLHVVPLPEFSGHVLPVIASVGGRSGSTLLMKVLAEHPLIVARRLHSFESRFAQALAILQDRATDVRNPIAIDSEVDEVGKKLATPFFQEDDFFSSNWFQVNFARHLREVVDDYYSAVAAEQNDPRPVFFAEKVLSAASAMRLREAYGQKRVVYAFRDPRDVFLSMRAHSPSWSGLGSIDDRTMLGIVCEWFRRGVASASESIDRHAVIRYEDLVTAPQTTIARMFANIGLPLSPDRVDAVIQRAFAVDEVAKAHMTSESAGASVGRWKRELSVELVALCTEQIGDLLEHVGYERSFIAE